MLMSTDARSLQLLLSWLSPSFPVGAYAFSHGLEYAVEHCGVDTPDALHAWVKTLLLRGSAQSDLVFAAHAYRAGNVDAVHAVAHEAMAFAPSAELQLENAAQGEAFVTTIRSAWPCAAVDELAALLPDACPYPVAVARVAHHHAIGETEMLTGFAHAFCANLVSAALRLVPLGQTDGQKVMAVMLADVDAAVARAMDTPLAAVASHTLMSDIASMKHEHQYTRLFRS